MDRFNGKYGEYSLWTNAPSRRNSEERRCARYRLWLGAGTEPLIGHTIQKGHAGVFIRATNDVFPRKKVKLSKV